jgi:hypothetical protein
MTAGGARGIVVVEALCYKPEGRGFETRCGELIFSIYLILSAALGPGVYSASNRNEYQKQKNNFHASHATLPMVTLNISPSTTLAFDFGLDHPVHGGYG